MIRASLCERCTTNSESENNIGLLRASGGPVSIVGYLLCGPRGYRWPFHEKWCLAKDSVDFLILDGLALRLCSLRGVSSSPWFPRDARVEDKFLEITPIH